MTTQNEMLEMPVAHLLAEADRRAREMGHLNAFSTRGLAGAQVGKLGELVAYEYLEKCKVDFDVVDLISHDVEFRVGGIGQTLEVKTKERSVVPKEDYECSLYEYTADIQQPDFYLFISLYSQWKGSEDINRFTKAYVLGSISSYEFDKKCRSLGTDFVDVSNNWSPSKGARNIYIHELKPPIQLGLVS
jgi:hypothetical protein